jgi:hypothetical protein
MPHYVHLKTVTVTKENEENFSDRKYASREEAFKNFPNRTDYTVTFLPTDRECREWRRRESERFEDGTYQYTPWSNHYLVQYKTETANHFAHLSTAHPGMVAYTPSEEFGVADRQLRVRPGKYLTQFYGSEFSQETIDDYCGECESVNFELQIARSTEDIVTIYSNPDVGFHSCMQARPDGEFEYGWQEQTDYDSDLFIHPVSVYGESDLAVAYRGPLDMPKQRAVVWPEKKQYVRIYGNGSLQTLLHNAGYRHVNSFDGARIRRIPYPRNDRFSGKGFYMPYIDGSDGCHASSDGQWFILGSGDTCTAETSGYVQEVLTYECPLCETHYAQQYARHGSDMCNTCGEHYYTCYHCHDHIDNRETPSVYASNSRMYCTPCWEEESVECPHGNCGTRHIPNTSDYPETVRTGQYLYCHRHRYLYTYCDRCDTLHLDTAWSDNKSRCPACERYPRCLDTLDLLNDSILSATPVVPDTIPATSIDWDSVGSESVAF